MTTPKNRQSPTAEGFAIATYTWDAASAIKQDVPFGYTPTEQRHGRIWTVEIDNTLNSKPVYLKFWWALGPSVTVGSTPPDMQLVAAGSTKQTYTFCGGPPMSKNPTYAPKFTVAVVSEPGTLGTTPVVAAVPVRILHSES